MKPISQEELKNRKMKTKNEIKQEEKREEELASLYNDRAELSDKEYWKLFETKYNLNGEFESQQNHDVSIDVSVKFKGLNGIVYESKQKNINCNIPDLEIFFKTLKKTIRMVDENISDNEGYDEDEDEL